MLSWLRRRLEKAERIDAKVKALTRAFGIDARNEARRRQREAESAEAAQEWRAVARAIARKTGRRVGLEPSAPVRATNIANIGDRRAAELLALRAPPLADKRVDRLVVSAAYQTGLHPGSRMEWPPPAHYRIGGGLRLGRQDLPKPLKDRPGDFGRSLERAEVLRPNGFKAMAPMATTILSSEQKQVSGANQNREIAS
jgi:hypothetical protein